MTYVVGLLRAYETLNWGFATTCGRTEHNVGCSTTYVARFLDIEFGVFPVAGQKALTTLVNYNLKR